MVGAIGSQIWSSVTSALGGAAPEAAEISVAPSQARPAPSATPASSSNPLTSGLQAWIAQTHPSASPPPGRDQVQQALKAYGAAKH